MVYKKALHTLQPKLHIENALHTREFFAVEKYTIIAHRKGTAHLKNGAANLASDLQTNINHSNLPQIAKLASCQVSKALRLIKKGFSSVFVIFISQKTKP